MDWKGYYYWESEYLFEYLLHNLVWWVSRLSPLPDINAWVTSFEMMSRASPLETNKVALFPTSKVPKSLSIPRILAGFRVIRDKAISLSMPKLEKLPA